MSDIVLKCKDCGEEFVITEGEQKFYKERNLNLPKRCKNCRQKRNQAKN